MDDVDNIAKNGGNLSFRAMGEQIYFDFFKNGNNFLSTGEKDNNLYGTGIYVLTVFDTPQISSICGEVTKNLPDARTDSEKKIVFAWGSEKEDED